MRDRVFFYSPMKPPDVSAASGVQRVAGLLVEAIRLAGFQVDIPDLPNMYDANGDAAWQAGRVQDALRAANTLVSQIAALPDRPKAWLSYHCYYKSPDVIGPIASKTMGCPYLVAEGSHADKRSIGPWAEYHRAATVALAQADVLLAATKRDRLGLEAVPNRTGKVLDFPPFVDCARFTSSDRSRAEGRVRILAAGSMTDRRKVDSFRRLFQSAMAVPDGAASLTIAGDGAHRTELEQMANMLRDKALDVVFLGQVPHSGMPDFYASGDIFAWPGFGEAYGLSYLEAQAAGLPVVAENSGGVSACVRDGISGFLTEASSQVAFAKALSALVADRELRCALGRSARAWVLAERSLPAAADRLRGIILESAR